MARIRTIKPEFPQSESVGRLSRDARLLFIQIWTIADDYGRCRAAERLLAGQLYPYDDDAPKLIGMWLAELERGGFIRLYEVEGSRYLDIPGWGKHQRVDNAGKSNIPEFRGDSPRTAASDSEPPLDLGPRIIGPRTIAPDGAPQPAEKKSRKKPSVSLPADFVPDREYAKSFGFTDRETDRELERFRNNAAQNARTCADWSAAWRNWVLKAAEFAGKSRDPPQASGFKAVFGSPEWEAWFVYTRQHGPKFVFSQMETIENVGVGSWGFQSRWPPGHQQDGEAA